MRAKANSLAPMPKPARLLDKLARSRHVAQLVDVHTEHHASFDSTALSSLWGHVAWLAAGRHGAGERRWMQRHAAALAPLRQHTERSLPAFDAKLLSQTSVGVAACCSALQHAPAAGSSTTAEWSSFWEPLSTAARATLANPAASKLWGPSELSATARALTYDTGGASRAPLLLDCLAAAAAPQLGNFSAAELSQTASAFARSAGRSPGARRSSSPPLLEALAAQASARVGEFSGSELVVAADAFARVRRSKGSSAVLAAIASCARAKVESLSCEQLSTLAWAYAASGELPSAALLDALADASTSRLGGFSARSLSVLLWAFAALGESSSASRRQRLFEAAAEPAAAHLREPHRGGFNTQGLCNLGWAFAVVDPRARLAPLFEEGLFVARCEERLGEEGLTAQRRQLTQLHQWSLWREESDSRASWPPLPALLRRRCHATFVDQRLRPSAWQLAVTEQLRALGYTNLSVELVTEQGYYLDVEIVHAKQRVAIEVDGPSHFVGRSAKLSGATQLKRRQLAAFGTRVISLPYQTAAVARRTDDASQQQLRDALVEAIVAVVGAPGDNQSEAQARRARKVSVRSQQPWRARFEAFYGAAMGAESSRND